MDIPTLTCSSERWTPTNIKETKEEIAEIKLQEVWQYIH
jgi:hypothetical protein